VRGLLIGLILLIAAWPLSVSAQATNQVAGADTGPSLKVVEEKVAELINDYRKSKDKPPLALDERLSVVCRQYSELRASGTDKDPYRMSKFAERFDATGVPRVNAYEIKYDLDGKDDPAATVVAEWLNEDKERAAGLFNTTAQFLARSTDTHIGVGAAKDAKGKYYFTALIFQEAAAP